MKKRLRRSTLTVRKFDENFTAKHFRDRCQEIFEGAAIEFVQTAAPMFPSLTGQAKAAVVNIAKSLGLESGYDAFSPPISEYEHLQVALWLWGNTPKRGETMGKSTIRSYTKSVAWEIKLDITAAHNGFEYFTYWDRATWGSMKAALASAASFIQRELSAKENSPIKLRVYKDG